MLNIEKYKDEIVKGIKDCQDVNFAINEISKIGNCRDCKLCDYSCAVKNLEWLAKEYSEPVLDDKEREYLSAVIRPFRKEVATISKFNAFEGSQYIYIEMKDRRGCNLPTFPKGTMYKGMIEGMHYSLKELGL